LAGITDDALTQRYDPPNGAGTACDATTHDQAVALAATDLCKDRAIFIPIIEAWPPAGQSGPVHILDLATFYIAGWDRSAPYGNVDVNGDTIPDDAMIWGYFLQFATVGT
jgi:hypothetical protein